MGQTTFNSGIKIIKSHRRDKYRIENKEGAIKKGEQWVGYECANVTLSSSG